jgi:hypothetical protein
VRESAIQQNVTNAHHAKHQHPRLAQGRNGARPDYMVRVSPHGVLLVRHRTIPLVRGHASTNERRLRVKEQEWPSGTWGQTSGGQKYRNTSVHMKKHKRSSGATVQPRTTGQGCALRYDTSRGIVRWRAHDTIIPREATTQARRPPAPNFHPHNALNFFTRGRFVKNEVEVL